MAYTNARICEQLHKAHVIAERIHRLRRARISLLCRESGIGDYNGCSVHNAMISYREGKPWREIDYVPLKKAVWLDRLPTGSEIIDRYYRRMVAESRNAA